MSDIPVLTGNGDSTEFEYQKNVISILQDVQSDFLGMKSFGNKVIGQIKSINDTMEEMLGSLMKDEKGKGGLFSGSLTRNKILPRDPGSVFIAQTMKDINEDNQKKSSGLWSLLGGGLLGGGLIAGAIGVLLSGLFDDGPFKGTKKLVGRIMAELGVGIMKRVIKPFRGFIDNIVKLFGDKILKPFRSFTDRIWKSLSGIADTLIKPFRSVFDNIIKWMGSLGGKLFAGIGKGPIGKAFGKVTKFITGKIGKLAKGLKFVPGIGSIISFGFAISRFNQGDITGGILELIAGIADFFPGIGTAISWGFDILLAARDLGAFGGKEGVGSVVGAKIGNVFGKVWAWVKEKTAVLGEKLYNLPVIKPFVDFMKAIGAGDMEGAFEAMGTLFAPLGSLVSLFRSELAGKDTKRKLTASLQSSGELLKIVGSKLLGIAGNIFGFIGNLGMFAIKAAGRGIRIGSDWLKDKVATPVMDWLGDKIGSAIQTAKDVGAWVNDNIIDPIGTFFTNIFNNIQRGIEATTEWVQNKLINPVYNFFTTAWEAITNAKDSVVDWVKEKLIWPIRDFFGGLGTFFDTLKNLDGKDLWNIIRGKGEGVFTDTAQGLQEGKIREVAGQNADLFGTSISNLGLNQIAKTLKEAGVYFQGITQVQDAIIRPNGQIIRTAPDDTLIATKNDVNRQSDREITATVNNMETYNDGAIREQNSTMIELLRRIADKEFNQQSTNVISGNTQRVNPRRVTEAMVGEVY
jgi:hypothetical protein